MLGLEALGAFEGAARGRAEMLSATGKAARADLESFERALRAAREQVDEQRRTLALRKDDADLQASLLTRLASFKSTFRLKATPSTAREAQIVATTAAASATRLRGLVGQAAALKLDADVPNAPEDAVEALERQLDNANKTRDRAQTEHQTVAEIYDAQRGRSEAIAKLAIDALPLLGDECPVCQQRIDSKHVAAHLEALLSDEGQPLRDIGARLKEASARLKEAEVECDTLARQAEAARQSRVAMKLKQAERATWRDQLAATLTEIASLVDLPTTTLGADANEDLLTRLADGLDELGRVGAELAAVMSSTDEGAALLAAEAHVTQLERDHAGFRERAQAASAAEESGKGLARAAVRASVAVTDNRFDLLRPLIQDVYSRLDPHREFTKLRFAVDVYREKATASAEVADREDSNNRADPLLVFSSAQANVVAVSVFLALGWAAGRDAMPFLLLDDPLQSMDDVNALGFADLCRHLRTQRQLIISTHDVRLAALLERKLAPRRPDERTRFTRFASWSRNGPEVVAELVAPQLDAQQRHVLVHATD